MRQMLHVALLALCCCCGCTHLTNAPQDPVADNLSLTSLSAPLTRDAFKAEITFAYDAPSNFLTGETRSIHLLVKNSSLLMWPYAGLPDTRYEVHAGNRWIDPSGTVIEDNRGPLSYDVHPGETIEVAVVVHAPTTAGEYTLEFDLVQEYVGWFKDMGSGPLRLKVRVQ